MEDSKIQSRRVITNLWPEPLIRRISPGAPVESSLIHGHPMTCLVGFSIALRQLNRSSAGPCRSLGFPHGNFVLNQWIPEKSPPLSLLPVKLHLTRNLEGWLMLVGDNVLLTAESPWEKAVRWTCLQPEGWFSSLWICSKSALHNKNKCFILT